MNIIKKKSIKMMMKESKTKNLEELFDNKILKFKSSNPKKIIECQYMKAFYEKNQSEEISKVSINIFNKEDIKNINKIILKEYLKKPDILIINFNNLSNFEQKINSKPRYPIFYNNVLYITPIILEQINGFSNNYFDLNSLLLDFFARIYNTIGAIISSNDFNFIQKTFDLSGFSDFNSSNNILSENNCKLVQSWMTNQIPTNDFGWMSYNNKLAVDYVLKNYNINSVCEFGTYMGYATNYIINTSKNNNLKYFGFDRYDNLFLTDFINNKISDIDLKFFYKYLRYETFCSNNKNANNLYTIKGDIYQNFNLLLKYKIPIDLFYIDFEKNDKKLIDFVEKIFTYYPNSIIIGDDVVHLKWSIDYLKNKYNLINLTHCYICTKNTKLINTNELLKKHNNYHFNINNNNINYLKNQDSLYRINFITKLIDKKEKIDNIIKNIIELNIDCNEKTDIILNDGNIFHYIANLSSSDYKYYKKLFDILNNKFLNKNVENNMNLTPIDYLNIGYIYKF